MEPKDMSVATDNPVPFIGLQNMGNTCYLNSVLQILYHCPGFTTNLSLAVEYLEKQQNTQPMQSDSINSFKVLAELNDLFCTLNKNQMQLVSNDKKLDENEVKSLSYVRPEKLFTSLRKEYSMFEPYTQQDAQECFHCILSVCKSAVYSFSENSQDISNSVATEKDGYKVVGGRKLHASSVLSSSENKKNVTELSHQKSNRERTCKATAHHKQRKPLKQVLRKVGVSKGDCVKGSVTDKQSDLPFSTGENNSDTNNLNSGKENRKLGSMPPNAHSFEVPHKRIRLDLSLKRKSTATVLKKLLSSKRIRGQNKVSSSNTVPRPVFNVLQSDPNQSKIVNTGCNSSNKYENHQCEIKCFLPKREPVLKTLDFVKDIFQGELVTSSKCIECETEVNRLEQFQDVSLSVLNTEAASSAHSHTLSNCQNVEDEASSKPAKVCSLFWALSEFTSVERLEGENKYHCDICLRLSEGERSILFNQLPPVFAFHLKRFCASTSITSTFGTSVSKITSAFEIPSSLKFSKWCNINCIEKNYEYKLFAMVVHSGTTITGGHYLSYVKYNHNYKTGNNSLSKYDGRWLQMDDEQVRLLSKEDIDKALSNGDFDIFSRSPYMLFYHRVSSDE